ncbi:MAG: hypothetical protein ABI351_13865 [Herbaspirillum sp.]
MPSQDFINMQKNLQTSALGAQFLKSLYLNPYSLSPERTTALMQQLGLNLSEDQVIAADAAQAVISGAAIIDAESAGSNYASVKNSANLEAVSVKGLIAISQDKGWLDSDTASVVNLGVDAGMLIFSGGADVGAWISLCIDMASAVNTKQGQATMAAYADLKYKLQNIQSSQSIVISSAFSDVQAGKISLFGMLAECAQGAPNLWPQAISQNNGLLQIFPELSLVPVSTQQVTGQGESSISGHIPWPINSDYVIARWHDEESTAIPTIANAPKTKEQAAKFIYEILLAPWTAVYKIVNDEVVLKGNASIQETAILSLMTAGDGIISPSNDYTGLLINTQITPWDLSDTGLFDYLIKIVATMTPASQKQYKTQAVSTSYNSMNLNFDKYESDLSNIQDIFSKAQASNNISELVKYPQIYAAIKSYFDFQPLSFELDPTLGGLLNAKLGPSVTAWRNTKNFLAVLSIMDMFRNDSYLSTTQYAQHIAPFLPSVDSFTSQYGVLQALSIIRGSDSLARAKIASLLGTTSDQLTLTNPGKLGPKIWSIK